MVRKIPFQHAVRVFPFPLQCFIDPCCYHCHGGQTASLLSGICGEKKQQCMKVHKLEELIHRTNSLMTLALLSFLMPLQKFYFYFCEMSYAVAVEKTICWLAHLLSIRLGSKCHCLLVGFGQQKRGLGNPTCTVIGTQKNRLLLASKFKLEHQNLSTLTTIVHCLSFEASFFPALYHQKMGDCM